MCKQTTHIPLTLIENTRKPISVGRLEVLSDHVILYFCMWCSSISCSLIIDTYAKGKLHRKANILQRPTTVIWIGFYSYRIFHFFFIPWWGAQDKKMRLTYFKLTQHTQILLHFFFRCIESLFCSKNRTSFTLQLQYIVVVAWFLSIFSYTIYIVA